MFLLKPFVLIIVLKFRSNVSVQSIGLNIANEKVGLKTS